MASEAEQVRQLEELIADLRARRMKLTGSNLENATAAARLAQSETSAHRELTLILRKAGPETLTTLPDDVLRSKLDEVEARIKKLRAAVS